MHRYRAGRLAAEGDLGRIAAEEGDVVRDPGEGYLLVPETEVDASKVGLLLRGQDVGGRRESEQVEAVVDADRYHGLAVLQGSQDDARGICGYGSAARVSQSGSLTGWVGKTASSLTPHGIRSCAEPEAAAVNPDQHRERTVRVQARLFQCRDTGPDDEQVQAVELGLGDVVREREIGLVGCRVVGPSRLRALWSDR